MIPRLSSRFRVVVVITSPSSPPEAGNAGENWHQESGQAGSGDGIVREPQNGGDFGHGSASLAQIERLYHAALASPPEPSSLLGDSS
jgi:hypothetical protein